MSGLKLTTATPGGEPRLSPLLRPKKNNSGVLSASSMGGLVDHGLCARPWTERSGFEPCSWARNFTLTVPLSTQTRALQKFVNSLHWINHFPVDSRGLFCF